MDSEKLNYFIKRTEDDFRDMKKNVQEVKNDVRQLLQFKWQIIGGSLVLSALISFAISVLGLIIQHKP